MGDQPTESITIDRIEPPARYLRHDVGVLIEHGKARTANVVAVILVTGVVLSLPLYVIVMWQAPAGQERIVAVFDKWYAIISPLVGTAIGAYYGSRSAAGTQGTPE